ncbi:unnamed protein product [Acanthosepion pharaonis]|uniref:Uncharacterized protein n=1 Tax=Acanthosepion pharaonis TaxID=158019 RepID=A0A812AU78_ACAPH|nr:unnamed protein product [Sepia pharaonis]
MMKQKIRSLSLSSWYDSILARDGLFFRSSFLSLPSRALFKGLVTVETAFSLFDIAAFCIRSQNGSIHSTGRPILLTILQTHLFSPYTETFAKCLASLLAWRRLTFSFHYSFPFSSCHVVNFQNINFFLIMGGMGPSTPSLIFRVRESLVQNVSTYPNRNLST